MIPIIFLLYIKEAYFLDEDKVMDLIIRLSLGYMIAYFGFQIFGICDYVELIPSTNSFILMSIMYPIIVIYLKTYGKDKCNLIQCAGVFLYTCCTMLEELMYMNQNLYFSGIYVRIGVLCFLFAQLILGVQEVDRKLKNKNIIKKQLEESRIKLMTRQMEPHFYSNALIAIQDLCYTDADKAADSIALFYSYLRTNINYISEEGLISFEEEIKLIHMYIEIQKLCYGDEIQYTEDIKVVNFDIPPLTIQPFIENSVHHGVRKRRGIGKIKLSSYYTEETIIIRVEDNGIGFKLGEEEYDDSIFSSTRTILYRIEKQCQGNVNIESVEGKGTVVTIKIPRSFIRE